MDAAPREVREEAGIEAEPVEKLGDVRYWYRRDGDRVLKIVSFFLFRYRSGSVSDHDREVEEARWIPARGGARAAALQGRARDGRGGAVPRAPGR